MSETLEQVISNFEHAPRGIPQAHMAARLVAELRAALAASIAQPECTPQADSQPTTGEPMGTEAQEATAWRLRAENLERENAALRELIAEAPSYFAPQYDFEGRKLAWIKSADAAIAAQGDRHE